MDYLQGLSLNLIYSYSGQSLEGVRVDMNGTLVIYRVGPSNKGAYRCSATNSLGMRYKTINLDIILVPPKLRYNRAIAYADLGGTIEIDCNSTGVPTPIVSWILPSGKVNWQFRPITSKFRGGISSRPRKWSSGS